MSDDILNIKVPILTPHKDQRLCIDFVKNEEGKDAITFSFVPEIPEVRTPAQAAAMNVAKHIIQSFGLDQYKEKENTGEKND